MEDIYTVVSSKIIPMKDLDTSTTLLVINILVRLNINSSYIKYIFYVGYWKHSKMNGNGVAITKTSDVIFGEWKEGNFEPGLNNLDI